MEGSPDATGLLLAWQQGDDVALERLLPLVESELRRLARHYMRGERPGHTLQATALVNEAYLRLLDARRIDWQNRAHFVGVAARMMRRVLVDVARAKGYQKRGAGAVKVTFDEGLAFTDEPGHDIVALDVALKALAEVDPRKSHVVEMRFFGGLSVEETASALGISVETVARDWRFAKAWLKRELGAEGV